MRSKVGLGYSVSTLLVFLLLATPLAAAPRSYNAGYGPIGGPIQGSAAGFRHYSFTKGESLEGGAGSFILTGPIATAIKDLTGLGDGTTVTLNCQAIIRVYTPPSGLYQGIQRGSCVLSFSYNGATYSVRVGWPDSPARDQQGDVTGSLSGNAVLTFDNDPFQITKQGRSPWFVTVVEYGQYGPVSFTITTSG